MKTNNYVSYALNSKLLPWRFKLASQRVFFSWLGLLMTFFLSSPAMAYYGLEFAFPGTTPASDTAKYSRYGYVYAYGSPLVGAKVDAGGYTYRNIHGVTDSTGRYNFQIWRRGCQGYSYIAEFDVMASFAMKTFDPEAPEFTDMIWAGVPDFMTCSGRSNNITGGCIFGFCTGGVGAKLHMQGIELSAEANNLARSKVNNMYVDTMMFSGVARLANVNEEGESLIVVGKGETTEYEYSNPSSTGLLKTLSEADLNKTDVYIFRESNGMMVAQQRGIFTHPNDNDHFFYRFPIPGARFSMLTVVGNLTNLEQRTMWQDAAGVVESLRPYKADHLRPGEAIKIIAINRPTGYIGVVTTTAAAPVNGIIDIPTDDIILRPPNLKIWAERIYSVEKGLTDGQQREYTIGFEGSGLTTDTMVSIHTQWLDQDGSPLPEGLEGYTGRMAKVSAPNTLNVEGGGTGTFGISPGNHQQVLKFKGDILGTEHFYVHVSGFSAWQSAGIGAASSGPLQYRPKNYVPIKVPVLNESATAQVRKLNAKAKAVYEWPYRPEMQFSVFDLKIKDISTVTLPDEVGSVGDIQSIYEDEQPIIGEDVSMVKFFFDLLENENAPLEQFGPERELVFSFGEQEVIATYGIGGQFIFEDIEQLAQLDPEDYLAMRLYDKNDSENILWEWAFGTEGIDLNTSLDEGSRIANSFIMCEAAEHCDASDQANTITAELVGEFKEGDTIVWTVEALEGSSVGDDLPGANSNASNKPYAYGKTQNWKVGRFAAVEYVAGVNDNKGRYSEKWQSQPIEAVNAKFFSFMPDMSADEDKHIQENYNNPDMCTGNNSQYLYCISGTNGTDVLNHNPHVGYRITAVLNDGFVPLPFEVKAKMDHIDVLRQEFVNHLISAPGSLDVIVPERESFKSIPATGLWVENNQVAPFNYDYPVMLESGMSTLLSQLKTIVNANINKTFTVNDTTSVTWPIGATLEVTSGFRNPERNERVGGATGSRHMLGRALDVGIHDVEGEDLETAYFILWKILKSTQPVNADMMQLEESAGDWTVKLNGSSEIEDTDWDSNNTRFPLNGIEDGFFNVTHLHLQDNP